MAEQYLLDTNIASYVIKGNIPRVRQRLLEIPMAQVAVSVVTAAELLFGVARKPEVAGLKIAVHEFLLRVDVLDWSFEAAQEYAILRAWLERGGKPMGNMDIMIAAQALAAHITLVTNDRAFRRIPSLKIEDWTKARS